MTKKNVLFLLIDALRFDVFSDMAYTHRIAPNLARLVERGFLCRVVNNGHATKFVMPSLFTQTYPLDYDGYNRGIGGRPKSYVELIRAAGYRTQLFLGHDIDGPLGGIDRGFDETTVFYDVDLPLNSYLRDIAPHEISLWRAGKTSQEDLLALLQSDMDQLLAQAEISARRPHRAGAHRKLGATTEKQARAYRKERELLASDPLAVVTKIEAIPAHLYRHYLGRPRPGKGLFLRRVRFGLLARLQNFMRRYFQLPLQFLSPRVPPLAGEMVDYAARHLSAGSAPWFTYIHVMDLHDCAIPIRFQNFLGRLIRMPRIMAAGRGHVTPRSLLYDSAVAYVDGQVGKLVKRLEDDGVLEDTMIMITGDHGLIWDRDRDPKGLSVFGFRTHYEFIDVPMALSGQDRAPSREGLLDSMSVSATLLDAMGIDGHQSFKGKTAFAPGRDVVINENAGRGNANLDLSDLYFTVVTGTRKLMTLLKESELTPVQFYDLENDPKELRNLIDDADWAAEIAVLTERLLAERAPLLSRRGALRDGGVAAL
jgi:hypothetical protein